MKLLSKEELYKKNQKLIKTYKILAPVVFWVCIGLAILCLILAVKNSFGNIREITELLETDTHTGEELQANYAMLTDKYGEWVIGNGNNGFQLVFINIKKAVFSGFMISCAVLSLFFFISAYLFGKWIFPYLSKKIAQDNQDMVNLTILDNKE